MKSFEKYLVLITFVLGFVGLVGLIPLIISIILFIIAGIYLLFGWKLLSPNSSNSKFLIPFLISYLIAQTVITIIFGINDYPLKNMFSYITSLLLLIAIILVLIFKRNLIGNYPVNKYLYRLLICLMFAMAPVFTTLILAA